MGTPAGGRWAPPLAFATQGVCVAALATVLLRPFDGSVNAVLSSALLALCIVLFVATAVAAAFSSTSVRRVLAISMAVAAAVSLLARLLLTGQLIAGADPGFPSLQHWIFILGAHPALLVGLFVALGLRRRGLQLEVLVDTLLLVVAAAIIILQLPFGGPEPLAMRSPVAHGLFLFWRSVIAGELFLLALLLAWRGEQLGTRLAAGLALGTVAFAIANALHSQAIVTSGAEASTAADPLWMLAILGFSIALSAKDVSVPSGQEERAAREIARLRGASVVVAILIAAASASGLGLRDEREPLLAVALGLFGAALAARAAHILAGQRREARALEHSVASERELSATLEQRVQERTSELADAQRVLRRMLLLGQQVTFELSPTRVLQRFVEAAVDIVQADGGALALVSDDASLRIVAASGFGERLTGTTLPLSGSAMGRVIREGRSWSHDDVADRPDLVHQHANLMAEGSGARGIAVVPVPRRGEMIGAVAVVSRAPRQFTAEELSRVEVMADMLSVALANAELVDNLRKAEWRFRTLFKAAPDAVLTVLQSGRVLEANDAVQEITGLQAQQMVGRILTELALPSDREALESTLSRAFEGESVRLECRLTTPDGSRLVSLAASRLPEADPPAVLLVGRDITAERDLRARLLETERLAAVGELVAAVAHEVNNPLSSISAFAQLLLRDSGLEAEQRESVEVIKAETMRAGQVVKDLLAFARRSEPQRALIDLNEVVARSLRLRGYQLTANLVTLEQRLEPGLPPVSADARQLQQVVFNLVANSIHAMSQQGGGRLRIATRSDDGQVVLEVQDSGPGIAESVRGHLFEPFVTTKKDGEGTGLGLSVSYGIISAHGGRIEVADSSERGTTVRVSLPIATEYTATEQLPQDVRVPPARSPLAGLRILFVDDEPLLRHGVEGFGRARGFTVVAAADGREALELVQSTSFDAIVCDLRMPGMDGIAFHDALRAERPGLASRLVFITGDVLAGGTRFAASVRQPTLMKPFALERLEEALVAVMRGVMPAGTA